MVNQIKIRTIEEKNEIIEYLGNGLYPNATTENEKRGLRRKCQHLVLENGVIKFVKSLSTKLIFICAFETDLISDILTREHQDSHYGIVKMVSIVNQKYYGISKEAITDFVHLCDSCQHYTPLRTLEDLTMVQITQKYDRYVIDCVDLRRYQEFNDGYSWLLNVVDSFTKFVWSYKLKQKTAVEVAEALKSCFNGFGMPVSIQADNGKEFSNQTLRSMCLSMNIQIIHGRPRNPKAQGMVERVNQTIKRWLAKVLFPQHSFKWIEVLEKIIYEYNISIHQATRKSPF